MNADEQLAIFERTELFWAQESRRLLAIIQQRGRAGKHRAWKQLLELAVRQAQLRREFNRFLETK